MILPFTLGSVLLVAAALKSEQLVAGQALESSFFTSRLSLTAIIEFELVLGLWL
jgi:hypothetical protein